MDLDDLIAVATERLPDPLAVEVVKRLRAGADEYQADDGSQPILFRSLPGLVAEATEEVADAIVYLNVVRSRLRDGNPVKVRLTEAVLQLITAHELIARAGRMM